MIFKHVAQAVIGHGIINFFAQVHIFILTQIHNSKKIIISKDLTNLTNQKRKN